MASLYLYMVAFGIIATIILIFFAWRIMRMHVTPTATWSLFFAAMIIRLGQQVWGLAYIGDGQAFVNQYPALTVIISYGVNALVIGLMFAFVARIYYELRKKFPENL